MITYTRKLSRVAVSKVPTQAKVSGNSAGSSIFSAYLTYEKNEDAHVAIQAVDGFAVDAEMAHLGFPNLSLSIISCESSFDVGTALGP